MESTINGAVGSLLQSQPGFVENFNRDVVNLYMAYVNDPGSIAQALNQSQGLHMVPLTVTFPGLRVEWNLEKWVWKVDAVAFVCLAPDHPMGLKIAETYPGIRDVIKNTCDKLVANMGSVQLPIQQPLQ